MLSAKYSSRIADFRKIGFEGFVRISDLRVLVCREIPDKPGVYLVLKAKKFARKFLNKSTGGHFKGKDPTVEIGHLEKRWLKNALILYVGKAGPGKTGTLRKRLKKYIQFGQGKPVAHWGGRYIWQLSQSDDLLICWKATGSSPPRIVEKKLIQEFEDMHGILPFANLCH
jgi:hypothetical protein